MERPVPSFKPAVPSHVPSRHGVLPAPVRPRSRSGARRDAAASKVPVISAPASQNVQPQKELCAPRVSGAAMDQRHAVPRRLDEGERMGMRGRGNASPKAAVAEHIRAAREVADLPDVVAPKVAPRNAPSVQQLAHHQDTDISSSASFLAKVSGPEACKGTDTSSPAAGSSARCPGAVWVEDAVGLKDLSDLTVKPGSSAGASRACEAVLSVDELTLPCEGDRTRLPAGWTRSGQKEPSDVVEVACRTSHVNENVPIDFEVKALMSTRGTVTPCSAFDSLGHDSLAYTADSTLSTTEVSFTPSGLSSSSASVENPEASGLMLSPPHSMEDEPCESGDVVVTWQVQSCSDSLVGSLLAPSAVEHPVSGDGNSGKVFTSYTARSEHGGPSQGSAAERNTDGLLCDCVSGKEREDTNPLCSTLSAGSEAPPVAQRQSVNVFPSLAEQAQDPAVDQGASERVLQLENRIFRLGSQISRLLNQVTRDLDAEARRVWGELYQLFQTKMDTDLTDEDQTEIEAYIFEHLPSESTDLIYPVYKVLHLEQERDRCRRLLASEAD